MTIGSVTGNLYLRNGSLRVGPKPTIDVFADRLLGGNPRKPFGTSINTF